MMNKEQIIEDARKIFAAENSVLVTPHYRFIIT